MHVCIVNLAIEFYSPVTGGAVATVIMETARVLLQRGHRVTIVTPIDETGAYEVGEVIGLLGTHKADVNFIRRRISHFRCRKAGWPWPLYDLYLRALEKAVKGMSSPPDVFITHNDLFCATFLKQWVPTAKTITWLHNEMVPMASIIDAPFRAIDAIVTVSDYIRSWTIAAHRLPGDKVVTILNGVDRSAYQPRADFLEPASPVRILFIGRIDRNKGPDVVVDAFARLREQGLSAVLTVAGGVWWYFRKGDAADPYLASLRTKLLASGGSYVGPVERQRVPSFIPQHDVVCLLARSNDPCPLVAFEAMASGCAVVASKRGGLPEILQDAAIYADPDNLEEVVSALQRLVTSPAILREYKERAAARVEETTWGTTVDKLERLMAALVPEPSMCLASTSSI